MTTFNKLLYYDDIYILSRCHSLTSMPSHLRAVISINHRIYVVKSFTHSTVDHSRCRFILHFVYSVFHLPIVHTSQRLSLREF